MREGALEQDAFAQYHPAVVLAYLVAAIVMCAVVQHPAYLAASVLAAATWLVLLRGRRALALIGGSVPFALVVAAVNPLFNTQGDHVLALVFGRPYTLEALLWGAAVAGMLAGMLLWFGCWTHVVTSDKLTCLFGNLAPALSLAVVMALRMVPDLARKAAQIQTARRCIGCGFSEGARLREKAAAGADVLSALADHALEGSVCTSDSMRARGYGIGRRTLFDPFRIEVRDVAVLALAALLLAATLGAGGMGAAFTPRLVIDDLTWGFAAYCVFLALPAALHAKEALRWRISLSRI